MGPSNKRVLFDFCLSCLLVAALSSTAFASVFHTVWPTLCYRLVWGAVDLLGAAALITVALYICHRVTFGKEYKR